MRRSVVFLAPVSLCLLATFACEDSNGFDNGSLNLDAGNLDVVAPPPPATDAEAVPDADAEVVATVTVTVTGSAVAKTDVEIVFQDATGAVIEAKKTGADGVVTSTGTTTPAMATALLHQGSQYSVITWTGLAGGDRLVVRGLEEGQTAVGSYDVSGQAFSGVSEIRVEASTRCRTTSQFFPVSVDVYPECVFGATGGLLAVGSSNGTATAFAFKKAVPTPAAADTAVMLGNWANAGSAMLTTTGYVAQTYIGASLKEIAAGAAFNDQGGQLDFTTGKVAFPIATGFADAYQATIDEGFSRTRRGQMKRSATAPIAFDLGAQLPALGDTTYSGDLDRPTIAWTGDTAATTGGAVQFRYPGNDKASFRWTIIVPPGTASVKMPALPADAGAFAPSGVASFEDYDAHPEVVFVASTIATPAALRAGAAAFGNIGSDGVLSSLIEAPAPVDGLVRYTALEQETVH